MAKLALQAIGIQFRLLLADSGINSRPLGLDDTERFAVVAPEDVVHEALSLGTGHPDDLELTIAILIERPAGFLEQEVDEEVAGCSLGVVVRIWP